MFLFHVYLELVHKMRQDEITIFDLTLFIRATLCFYVSTCISLRVPYYKKMIDCISQLLGQPEIVLKQLMNDNTNALKSKCGLFFHLQIESDKQKFVEKAKQEALKKVAEQRLREGKTPLPAGYTPQSSNAKVPYV